MLIIKIKKFNYNAIYLKKRNIIKYSLILKFNLEINNIYINI